MHPLFSPAVDLLRGDSDAVALWSDDGPLSYGALADLVAERARTLGTTRRLVMLACRNTVESFVTYLAALQGAHPILLAPGGEDGSAQRSREALIARFDPDVVASEARIEVRRDGTSHTLHEELALLLSTSGSTGSPRLVRLSADNLLSNAAAIADYLALDHRDRAITALPMHYCYGLSVINSHLIAGGALALTEHSLTDDEFWRRAAEAEITGIAGVPYSFELLDAVGGPARLPGSVRHVTQAGGRLPVEKVRELARAGAERGFAFFTMYGQTEATARMSYLPPEDAIRAAGSIGRPIPGGSFRIDAGSGGGSSAAGAADAGELVYSGPNVMLGYAETPQDLALGRTIEELRTGDLARLREDGYVEIVGRISRFVKIFGLRVDLDAVQGHLESAGIPARTAAVDEQLLVFVRRTQDIPAARDAVARLVGIPARHVVVHRIDAFPMTQSGKSDGAALVRLHRSQTTGDAASPAGRVTAQAVRDVLALCTTRPDASEHDSFSGLGGDSLGYVEAAVRLEDLLGSLPRNWPSLTATELALGARQAAGAEDAAADPAVAPPAVPAAPRRRPRFRDLETPVLLRALAIVLIVGTHAHLYSLQGGAHLLLIVAGYNLARFALSSAPGSRPRRLLVATAQTAIPAVLWIAAVGALSGMYKPMTALLLNSTQPSDGRWNDQWQFWFLEAVVWSMVALAVVFAVPAIDRLERRFPWGFAAVALVGAAAVRYVLVGTTAHGLERYALPVVLWCVALGWLIARGTRFRDRIIASAATLLLVPGFFGQPLRETIVAAGALALIWIPTIRIPAIARPAVALIASTSLFVYLTHWIVFPWFEHSAPLLGTVLSFGLGIAASFVHRLVLRALRRSSRVRS